jgi:colanic acid/amylovoran biosynthesis protein
MDGISKLTVTSERAIPTLTTAEQSPENLRLGICLFGASPDTGNLGVSALQLSIMAGACKRVANASITVFDHQAGIRQRSFNDKGRTIEYYACGMVNSRRLWRAESMWRMRVSALFGTFANAGVETISGSAAVLDISGGDSFTDLYGIRRFRTVTVPKLLALQLGKPLVLLPQTYGPFTSVQNKRLAARIVQAARMSWARDSRSFEVLRDLADDAFAPHRHRLGVDVAFALSSEPAPQAVIDAIEPWLRQPLERRIAINVSGLLWNAADGGREQYGLIADYRKMMTAFLRSLVTRDQCRVLLVPHVNARFGHFESDPQACAELAAAVMAPDRVLVMPTVDDPRQAKSIIGQSAWFCGTRMHSAIAALSSGVPTAAISYSDKTLGVFETCNQGDHVHDPRALEEGEMIERLLCSYHDRHLARMSLARRLPHVLHQAEAQMDEICSFLRTQHRGRVHSAELASANA